MINNLIKFNFSIIFLLAFISIPNISLAYKNKDSGHRNIKNVKIKNNHLRRSLKTRPIIKQTWFIPFKFLSPIRFRNDSLKKQFIGPQNSFKSINNSVNHGNQHTNQSFHGPSGPPSPNYPQSTCTTQDLVILSPTDLVVYLKANDFSCLYYLWSYNSDFPIIYSEANMVAVLNEIESLSSIYTGADEHNLHELMFFVRVGYYHVSYQYLLPFSSNVDLSRDSAFDSFSQSVGFNINNREAAQVLYEWINAIDAAEAYGSYYDKLKSILEDYQVGSDRWGDYYQNNNAFSVSFAFFRGIWNGNTDMIQSVDQSLIDILKSISLNLSLIPESTYVINEAVWLLGNIISISSFYTPALEAVTEILFAHELYSQPYLWAVYTIDRFASCQTSNPTFTICKSDVIPAIEAIVFPNQFEFDDGTLTFETSIPIESIQFLYHAIKQVQSQFNRITRTITPLRDDQNGKLTIKIYGTRQEYEDYQWFLYDLPTSNGGIYIEDDGVIYTYERTPAESIYTLEELLRHEYSHYLIGRYLIEGFWGQVPIYDNNRMVWFDEGFAEFLTWSTQSEGVKPRLNLVEQVSSDSTSRMSLNQVFTATYGDFKFYRYAGLFFNYLYENANEVLYSLVTTARTSDIVGFDSLIDSLKTDTILESNYQGYLDDLINQLGELDDPYTNFTDVSNLDLNDLTEIENTFHNTRLGYNGDCSLAATSLNSRFSCRGVLTGPLKDHEDEIEDWMNFDAGLNEIIEEATSQGNSNNFLGMNCRMGELRYNNFSGSSEQVYALADYFCEGPLGDGNFSTPDPLTQITEDFHNTRLGVNAICYYHAINQIICEDTLTTQAYLSLLINNNILESYLEDDLTELQNQVYATRPYLYHDFSCDFKGVSDIVYLGLQKRYMVRDIECVINL